MRTVELNRAIPECDGRAGGTGVFAVAAWPAGAPNPAVDVDLGDGELDEAEKHVQVCLAGALEEAGDRVDPLGFVAAEDVGDPAVDRPPSTGGGSAWTLARGLMSSPRTVCVPSLTTAPVEQASDAARLTGFMIWSRPTMSVQFFGRRVIAPADGRETRR
jgi:hypothetical protein